MVHFSLCEGSNRFLESMKSFPIVNIMLLNSILSSYYVAHPSIIVSALFRRPPWSLRIYLSFSWRETIKTYHGLRRNKISGFQTKRADQIKQGMVDGGVFRPIPSKTPLGVTQHHPYGPFCNFKHGRNPIFDEMVAFCPDLWLSLVWSHNISLSGERILAMVKIRKS